MFGSQSRANGHFVGVAIEHVNFGVFLQGDGGDFGAFGAQPFGALFAHNFDVGAILGEAGFEAAGAAVREDGVNAQQDENLAFGVGGGGVVLFGNEFAGVSRQFFRAAPLVVANVRGHFTFGEGGDEVVGQDWHFLVVGGFDRGDGRIGADGVDGDVLHAFFQQLFHGGDKGGKVAFAGGGLHVQLPAEFFGLGVSAVNHSHVEGAGQRRGHKAGVNFAAGGFFFGGFGGFGFFLGRFSWFYFFFFRRFFGRFGGFGFFLGRRGGGGRATACGQ